MVKLERSLEGKVFHWHWMCHAVHFTRFRKIGEMAMDIGFHMEIAA